MEELVQTAYRFPLVGVSFLMAVIGSFVALTAAGRIVDRRGRINPINAGAAGLALGGIGVWSMHFIGMLALQMNVGYGYSIVETMASLVAAILAASLALVHVAKDPGKLSRLLVAGTGLGLGVGVMHYLGMFGMRFGGYIRWDFGVVALSMLIAVLAATAALWLAFRARDLRVRLAAAVIMGVAVCAMHYTGMSAADFICTTTNKVALPQGFGVVSSFQLQNLVVVVAVGLALAILVDQILQSFHQPATS